MWKEFSSVFVFIEVSLEKKVYKYRGKCRESDINLDSLTPKMGNIQSAPQVSNTMK